MVFARVAQVLGSNPLLALMCLGAAPLLWTVERRRAAWLAILFVAACFHVLTGGPTAPYFASKTIAVLGKFGVVCALTLMAQAVWRREARFPAFVFVVVVLQQWCTGIFLRHTSTALPYTYDHRIAFVEGSVGLQPSFAVGRLFTAVPAVADISFLAYNALLFGLLLLCAGLDDRDATELLLRFAGAGLAGGALYFLLPVSGPLYGFPQEFPRVEPTLSLSSTAASLLAPSPRNGIPSLHLTWALLFFFRARFGPAWRKATFALLLLGTATATLGLGEHYFTDLVIAVPFACAVMSVGNTNGVRWAPAAYLLLALTWMCVLRLSPEWLASPALLLTAEMFTIAVPLYWFSRTQRRPVPAITPQSEAFEEVPK